MPKLITRGLGSATLITRWLQGSAVVDLDLREAIAAVLLGSAAVTAVVGTRIRPGGFSGDDTGPSIGFWVTTTTTGKTLRGKSGMDYARVQVDCWSRKLSSCVAARKAVLALFSGRVPSVAGFPFVNSQLLEERDLHESPDDGSDLWLYHIAIVLRIKYRSPVNPYP